MEDLQSSYTANKINKGKEKKDYISNYRILWEYNIIQHYSVHREGYQHCHAERGKHEIDFSEIYKC